MWRDLHASAPSKWSEDGRHLVRASGLSRAVLCSMLLSASCSHEAVHQVSSPAPNRVTANLSGSTDGQLIEIGTLQTGRDKAHYYLAVRREPGGHLRLTFLVAADAGLQPATALEGSVLTLLVAEKGRENFSSQTIELRREDPQQPEGVVFAGQLPEAVQQLALTAVIPRLRIGGQRLHARFTLPVAADGQE